MLAGKNVVSFYGDDYLQNTTVSVSQPDLVFLVANLTDTGSSSMFMFDGKSSRQTIHIHATNQWSIFAGAEPRAGTSDNSPHLFTALFNGSSSALWLDGTSIISTNAGTASLTGISLGARGAGDLPIIGDIAEVMVVSSPSSVDRQSIEGYLAHKWGLSGSLPSNHSHKTVSLWRAPIVTPEANSSSSAGTYYVRPSDAQSKKYSFHLCGWRAECYPA